MEPPPIQYAITKDEVSIAFWSMGTGHPLVYMQGLPFSHLALEWEIPEWRSRMEQLGQNRMLIRFDNRGFGLSQRGILDFSVDALLLDLEAVVDRLGLQRFALFGMYTSGPLAISYAAHHPDQVSHLILLSTWARASDVVPRAAPLVGLIEKDWTLFTEASSHSVFGWSKGEMAHRAAQLLRESATRETVLALLEQSREVDFTELLPRLCSPTLVLQPRQRELPAIDLATHLASAIPNARLVVLEGESGFASLLGMGQVVRVIEAFLGNGLESVHAGKPGREMDSPPSSLSHREYEVLQFIAAGLSNSEIAERLIVSLSTVKTHINSIYRKLDVRSRTQAVARARELNLA